MSVIVLKNPYDPGLYQMAIMAIGRTLESRGVYLPAFFYETLVNSSTPNQDLEKLKNSLSYIELLKSEDNSDFRVELQLAGLEAVHDQWRRENVAKFHFQENASQRYRFLPFVFIGLGAVREYLPYVDPILNVIGLKPAGENIASAYENLQRQFFDGRNVKKLVQLMDLLSDEHLDVDPSIGLAIRNSTTIAALAGQVIEHSCGTLS